MPPRPRGVCSRCGHTVGGRWPRGVPDRVDVILGPHYADGTRSHQYDPDNWCAGSYSLKEALL